MVVVDLHNALEKGDVLSNRTIRSLAKLALAAEVHILSYVGTDKMKKRTINQMGPHSPASDGKDRHLQDLLAADWPGGKVDIACGMHAGLVHL